MAAPAVPFDWAKVIDYARRETPQVPRTQYELPGVTIEEHGSDAVPVVVPPAWHAVVTGRLTIPRGDSTALTQAQRRLTLALEEIENVYPLNPQGIFVQVAYGLPYFRDYVPQNVLDRHMPKATKFESSPGEWALIESIKFPKDKDNLVLEHNDICFHFKSDYREHIENVIQTMFSPGEYLLNGIPATSSYIGDLVSLTSIRKGFLGRNLPKLIGERLRIPGADKIPAGAMLSMGFTSSHLHGLAQGNLPSFETLPGYTDQQPDSYFAHGTFMHLSHILIDLPKWYAMSHSDRLHRMFNPRRTEPAEHLSPSQAPDTTTFLPRLEEDARQHHVVGHNAQMQFLSRVEQDTTTVYGNNVPKGTVFFLRQDFDTVENPFEFWTEGALNPEPRLGVHFIGQCPSAQLFAKIRIEMDGGDVEKQYNLPLDNVGFTSMLTTTHRQNYLEPPRAHRSFPLAEVA
ncbi:MAG: DUF7405 family protein [Chloroflexota bacterium]